MDNISEWYLIILFLWFFLWPFNLSVVEWQEQSEVKISYLFSWSRRWFLIFIFRANICLSQNKTHSFTISLIVNITSLLFSSEKYNKLLFCRIAVKGPTLKIIRKKESTGKKSWETLIYAKRNENYRHCFKAMICL